MPEQDGQQRSRHQGRQAGVTPGQGAEAPVADGDGDDADEGRRHTQGEGGRAEQPDDDCLPVGVEGLAAGVVGQEEGAIARQDAAGVDEVVGFVDGEAGREVAQPCKAQDGGNHNDSSEEPRNAPTVRVCALSQR